jgi:hypothetical protein
LGCTAPFTSGASKIPMTGCELVVSVGQPVVVLLLPADPV